MNSLSDSLLDAIEISNTSAKELTYARLQIETLVLREAIKHIDDGDIADLKETIAKAKEQLSKGLQAFRENINFHKLLAKASKNHVFVIVVEAMMTVVANFLSRRGQPNPEASSKITSSHETILNEIVHGNAENAISLMEAHLWGVDHLFTPLERLNNSDPESL
jgi:GntR family transcriptional repressor for pyruvate dehydrogenase complex